jgi:hypothetical protein
MRKIRLVVLLSVPLVAALWSSASQPRPDIAIVGSARFTDQITMALALLKSKAPEAYAIVTDYVRRIEQGEHSGMWAYRTPPTYEINDRTAFYSVTWCAATIAHDSFHSKLYHDYKRIHGEPVPDAVWTGTAAEKRCMKHQLRVMALIGAPKNETEYAKSQAGGHYVDDKETWSSYKTRRNW